MLNPQRENKWDHGFLASNGLYMNVEVQESPWSQKLVSIKVHITKYMSLTPHNWRSCVVEVSIMTSMSKMVFHGKTILHYITATFIIWALHTSFVVVIDEHKWVLDVENQSHSPQQFNQTVIAPEIHKTRKHIDNKHAYATTSKHVNTQSIVMK